MDDMEQAERLANTYADAILRLSYTYLKNTHDAQDICQTVFVKLLMEPREFKSPEHERAYILRMAANACKDLLPPQLLYRKKSPYPKTYSPVYENLLAKRFRRMLSDPKAPVHRFLDERKAERFLEQPKDYGRPWFGQLMAGPQMIAYFLQINYWMERCGIG